MKWLRAKLSVAALAVAVLLLWWALAPTMRDRSDARPYRDGGESADEAARPVVTRPSLEGVPLRRAASHSPASQRSCAVEVMDLNRGTLLRGVPVVHEARAADDGRWEYCHRVVSGENGQAGFPLLERDGATTAFRNGLSHAFRAEVPGGSDVRHPIRGIPEDGDVFRIDLADTRVTDIELVTASGDAVDADGTVSLVVRLSSGAEETASAYVRSGRGALVHAYAQGTASFRFLAADAAWEDEAALEVDLARPPNPARLVVVPVPRVRLVATRDGAPLETGTKLTVGVRTVEPEPGVGRPYTIDVVAVRSQANGLVEAPVRQLRRPVAGRVLFVSQFEPDGSTLEGTVSLSERSPERGILELGEIALRAPLPTLLVSGAVRFDGPRPIDRPAFTVTLPGKSDALATRLEYDSATGRYALYSGPDPGRSSQLTLHVSHPDAMTSESLDVRSPTVRDVTLRLGRRLPFSVLLDSDVHWPHVYLRLAVPAPYRGQSVDLARSAGELRGVPHAGGRLELVLRETGDVLVHEPVLRGYGSPPEATLVLDARGLIRVHRLTLRTRNGVAPREGWAQAVYPATGAWRVTSAGVVDLAVSAKVTSLRLAIAGYQPVDLRLDSSGTGDHTVVLQEQN